MPVAAALALGVSWGEQRSPEAQQTQPATPAQPNPLVAFSKSLPAEPTRCPVCCGQVNVSSACTRAWINKKRMRRMDGALTTC